MEPFDKMPVSVRLRRDLNATAKGVHAYLLTAGRAKYSPGVRRIAEECGISKWGADRSIAVLGEVGLLACRSNGKGRRSRYEALLPESDELFDMMPVGLRRRADINWNAKVVHGYLARSIRQGESPGERTIADACGTTRRTVRRAVLALTAAGLIDTIQRTDRSPMFYRLRGSEAVTERAHSADEVGTERGRFVDEVGTEPAHSADEVGTEVAHFVDEVGTEPAHSSDEVGTEPAHSSDDVGTEPAHSSDEVGTEPAHSSDEVGTEPAHSSDEVGTEPAHSSDETWARNQPTGGHGTSPLVGTEPAHMKREKRLRRGGKAACLKHAPSQPARARAQPPPSSASSASSSQSPLTYRNRKVFVHKLNDQQPVTLAGRVNSLWLWYAQTYGNPLVDEEVACQGSSRGHLTRIVDFADRVALERSGVVCDENLDCWADVADRVVNTTINALIEESRGKREAGQQVRVTPSFWVQKLLDVDLGEAVA